MSFKMRCLKKNFILKFERINKVWGKRTFFFMEVQVQDGGYKRIVTVERINMVWGKTTLGIVLNGILNPKSNTTTGY